MLLTAVLGESIADLGRGEDVFDGLGYFWPDTVPFDERDCVFTLEITGVNTAVEFREIFDSKDRNVGSRLVLCFL